MPWRAVRRALTVATMALGWLWGPGTAPATAATYSVAGEKWFDRGLKAYQKGALQKARDAFEELVDLPRNQRSTAGHLMLGRTLFRSGEYDAALQVLRRLEKAFPETRYLADAELLCGDCRYRQRRYAESALCYGRALATPGPMAAQASAAERLCSLVKNELAAETDLVPVGQQLGADRLQEALLFGEARWYQRLNWGIQSRALMQQYRSRYPRGLFAALAENPPAARAAPVAPSGLVAETPAAPVRPVPEARRGEAGRPRLGLLLPLSGPQRQLGEDLLAGAQLANEERGNPFDLVSVDTGCEYGELPVAEGPGGELMRTAAGARALATDQQVLATVGPVFSSGTVAAGIVAAAAGLPLIAPLAQQTGLDTLGPSIFQLNVTPEIQGRVLGEYAARLLGLRNLVLVAPLSDYGWYFARRFVEAVAANGGQIAYQDWYVPGEQKDFKRLFEEVRRVGAALAPPPPPDTLASPESTAAGLGDSSAASGEPVGGVPGTVVAGIDGFALIVESFADARTILPQLFFYRVHTQVLGNDIWGQAEALQRMQPADRDYFRGVVFTSRCLGPAPSARSFAEAFLRRYGRESEYAAHGYDAARLVLDGWAQGSRTRDEVRAWLADVRGFEGAAGRISFSPGRRANTELQLLQLDHLGRARPLGAPEPPDWSLPEEPPPPPAAPDAAPPAPD